MSKRHDLSGRVKGFYQSRNLALARMLKKKGLSVFVCDELLTDDEIESVGLKAVNFDCFNMRFGREEACAIEIGPSELSSQLLMKSC